MIVVTKYKYLIRWYDKTDGIFPKILQVFRLVVDSVSLSALTFVGGFRSYANHIDGMNHYIFMIHQVVGVESSDEVGSRKKVHYVGTDLSDNFLNEGISRYEYVVKFTMIIV